MARYYGELPRPRVLVHGFPADSKFVAFIRRVVPTVRLIDSDELRVIRQKEWDATVTRGDIDGLDEGQNIFKVGGGYIGRATQDDGTYMHISATATSHATHFQLSTDLHPQIHRLSHDDLLPKAQKEAQNTVWFMHPLGRTISKSPRLSYSEPFLRDADGEILAGRVVRGSFETWWLPDLECDLTQWFAAALEIWNLRNPEAFPVTEEWKQRSKWQIPAEKDLESRRTQVRSELTSTIAKLAAEEESLGSAISEKSAQVDSAERLLLTAQGDPLVGQVAVSLAELGFSVVDVDKDISTPGDRREDLRISDSSDQDWCAIAEVRGYSRGAQLNDLLRLNRFVVRYVKEQGREPSAVWYIVNQEINKDPETRQLPLSSNKSEVATFAESGGLVIDTRDLFRILIAVREGRMEASAVRQKLRESSGHLQNALALDEARSTAN
ncbi:hypothetical protein ABZ721_39290 [Streptomyces sp. NPDC006733]|uniref:hypothetical protein n=1 Tax=Streptomyces sp. NPDC006733 TaxID=3155460 RepID=UPI00341122A3